MIGKLKDIAFTRNGEQVISFITKEDFREEFDELHESDVEVKIKKRRKGRSLDANAYCWVLIDKLAEKLRIPKEQIYCEAIRNIGGVSEIVCVKKDGFDHLKSWWTRKGIGWQVEPFPSKIEGCVNVILYSGSSTFDTKQMSDLIDAIIQECETAGIPTTTPEEIEKTKSLWASAPEKGRRNG